MMKREEKGPCLKFQGLFNEIIKNYLFKHVGLLNIRNSLKVRNVQRGGTTNSRRRNSTSAWRKAKTLIPRFSDFIKRTLELEIWEFVARFRPSSPNTFLISSQTESNPSWSISKAHFFVQVSFRPKYFEFVTISRFGLSWFDRRHQWLIREAVRSPFIGHIFILTKIHNGKIP